MTDDDNHEPQSGDVPSFETTSSGGVATVQYLLLRNPALIPVFVLALSVAAFWWIAGDRFFPSL